MTLTPWVAHLIVAGLAVALVACGPGGGSDADRNEDAEDNDGDGLIDTADPDCPTPCDDDEEHYAPGLPDDALVCRPDCLVDDNFGLGVARSPWPSSVGRRP